MNNTNSNEGPGLPRPGGVNWRPAMALFGDVSTWIIVPIILALVVGKKLDTHFNTEPKIFLVCASIGFLMTIFGIVKVIRRYMGDIQKIEDQNKK